jgi:sarcosine oxidase
MADDDADANARRVLTMAREDVDVLVIGLGALGAATLNELAASGAHVLGIDQFEPGHSLGSSHGRSRALRFLYHAPEYVTLLRPALAGWRALERAGGRQLYWECGTLYFARPGNRELAENLSVARQASVPHEVVDPDEAGRRWPAFAMTPGAEGIFFAEGGMIDAEAAVATMLDQARKRGAEVRARVAVRSLELGGDRPVATTDAGTIRARHVVVAAGAWTARLLPEFELPIRVTRQSFFTMRPDLPRAVAPDRVPVWCDYDTMYYGFPDHGPGLKIADDTPNREVDPGGVDRSIDPEEEATLTAYLRQRFPSSSLELIESGTCLYTLTPDEDFLLGPVPGVAVSVAVGLNHAFKFAPVIGRILADLATTGTTAYPIDRFRLDRFVPAAAG